MGLHSSMFLVHSHCLTGSFYAVLDFSRTKRVCILCIHTMEIRNDLMI